MIIRISTKSDDKLTKSGETGQSGYFGWSGAEGIGCWKAVIAVAMTEGGGRTGRRADEV